MITVAIYVQRAHVRTANDRASGRSSTAPSRTRRSGSRSFRGVTGLYCRPLPGGRFGRGDPPFGVRTDGSGVPDRSLLESGVHRVIRAALVASVNRRLVKSVSRIRTRAVRRFVFGRKKIEALLPDGRSSFASAWPSTEGPRGPSLLPRWCRSSHHYAGGMGNKRSR